jgi:hypothetical protein
MPAGGFKTFTSGAVLTASDVNAYLMQGVLVFTTETARNAAVSSPQEGMAALITTPATPAATGAATYVPGSILTVYNGAAWVCLSEVGAYTSNSGTTTSTTFTPTLSGTPGTNPSVTISTGTTALVTVSAAMLMNVASNGNLGFAVSGASTVAASTSFAAISTSVTNTTSTLTAIVSGLTAGTNTFTMQYSINPSQTLTVSERRIIVRGLL